MRKRGHPVFAALYDRLSGPLERAILAERRARLLADLDGQILDIGAGTGANLPHFRRASRVVTAEPDPAMRTRMAAKLAAARVPVELTGDAAESLRQADASFDAVVFTMVLCTVCDPGAALAEARRVLKSSRPSSAPDSPSSGRKPSIRFRGGFQRGRYLRPLPHPQRPRDRCDTFGTGASAAAVQNNYPQRLTLRDAVRRAAAARTQGPAGPSRYAA